MLEGTHEPQLMKNAYRKFCCNLLETQHGSLRIISAGVKANHTR